MEDQIQLIEQYSIEDHDSAINKLFTELRKTRANSDKITDKINFFSERLLLRPYILGALGEGMDAKFDQSPLYRVDAFDCLTFVNIVLALALSSNLDSFKKHLIKISYHSSGPDYVFRNHFMSADWNKNNSNIGIIKDITEVICANDQDSIQIAEATIDRPNWFRHRKLKDIKLIKKIENKNALELLAEMHALANYVTSEQVKTPYLPIKTIVDEKGRSNQEILNQIPHGAIIEIVRPNWDLTKEIGTHLNVSHMGFAIRRDNQLFFRNASQVHRKVEDVLLVEYLYERITSPTIKGINIQQVTA